MTTVAEAVNELREDVPLKAAERRSRLWNCSEDCLGGSKFINISFGTLTIIITIALLVQIYYGDYQVVPHGSVATDNFKCSEIGTYILKKGGNSVDAVIASAFCMAVVAPHIVGLDAEGEILIYNHKTRVDPTIISFTGSHNTSNWLPKLVLGLADVHRIYGSLPWKNLVAPSADLARYGFPVSKQLAAAIEKFDLQSAYHQVQTGEVLQLRNLAHTLDIIAFTPEDELYKNHTGEAHFTFNEVLKASLHNYNVFMPNYYPTMGPILSTILQYMEHSNITHENKPQYFSYMPHIVQSVYEQYNVSENFHQGTSSNIAAMDLDDTYVSLTMGMSAPFGSKEMSDFGYMPDAIKGVPCTRLPLVVVDSKFICGKRMVLGAADPADAAQVLFSLLFNSQNVTAAIEAPRFKMFLNGTIGIEVNHSPKFPEDVIHYYLDGFGPLSALDGPYDSCNIVAKRNDELSSHSDSRGGGIASRF